MGRARRKKAERHLAAGQWEEAVALYRKDKAWDALADAHEKRGEYLEAAEAAKEARQSERAAELYEKAGAYRQAAEIWISMSRGERAAVALEKAKHFEAAADVYARIGRPAQAAAMLASAGKHAEAGKLYEQAAEFASALEMYELANQPERMAVMLEGLNDFEGAARVQLRMGEKGKAAELFERAQRPIEAAQCYLELGEFRKAGELLAGAEHVLAAAEAYEKDETTLGQAAELFRTVLRGEEAWRQEVQGPALCLGMSECGRFIGVGAAQKLRMFDEEGELLWCFVPTWGGEPRCLAVSPAGLVALGCDDEYLYLLTTEKKLLWAQKLPGEAMKVSMDAEGKVIACVTRGNELVCLSGDGNRKWNHHEESIIWDVSVARDGKMIALGLGDGRCVVMTERGEKVGEYQAAKWVHSVSLGDRGSCVALGTGMQGVELVAGETWRPVWSVQGESFVHNVALTADRKVLAVADAEAVLRDESGTVIWRYDGQERLLGGCVDAALTRAAFRCAGKKVLRVNVGDCRVQAARDFAGAGKQREAGELYEEMGDHEAAAEMFSQAGDYARAGHNTESAGLSLEAAELYERAGEFEKAGKLFEGQGELARGAVCFKKAGELLKAAELYERSGDLEKACELFEQGKEHGKAGALYRALGDRTGAIRALSCHVEAHPEDWERRFELGTLLEADGQYDLALGQFQQTAGIEECRKRAVVHVAGCFMGKGMYEIAVERYKAAIEGSEAVTWENREVYYGLGRAYHLAGHYPEAKRIYESILAIDYRYKDVAERLEDVRKLSSVFGQSAAASQMGSYASTMVADPGFQNLSAEKKERYVPLRKLGEGGMGTVYLAEDKRLNRKVALKMLAAGLRADEKMRLRIVQEAQLSAQVVHPNVVAVFDVGEEQGCSYVSMEYVEGDTLRDLLEEKETYTPGECVELLLQITGGLACAHEKGVSHRDMKPENIMVTKNGTAKIMDFGLAILAGATRLTMPGGVSGTPLYMAPEQIRGESKLTPAVDVYAVGCLAYELLVGRPPFAQGNVATQHLHQPPKSLRELRPEVPEALEGVILKCLEKEPADRYANGGSLYAALQEVARGLGA
ncbi:MAG: protein kinase [Planctomycetota bacterium]